MASRNLLHVSKLGEFKQWLEMKGIEYRPGKGSFQVLQVMSPQGWGVIFDRNDAKEHYTVSDKLIPTVLAFVQDKNPQPLVPPPEDEEVYVPLDELQFMLRTLKAAKKYIGDQPVKVEHHGTYNKLVDNMGPVMYVLGNLDASIKNLEGLLCGDPTPAVPVPPAVDVSGKPAWEE